MRFKELRESYLKSLLSGLLTQSVVSPHICYPPSWQKAHLFLPVFIVSMANDTVFLEAYITRHDVDSCKQH